MNMNDKKERILTSILILLCLVILFIYFNISYFIIKIMKIGIKLL